MHRVIIFFGQAVFLLLSSPVAAGAITDPGAIQVAPANARTRMKEALQVMEDLEKRYPFLDLEKIRKDWNGCKRSWVKSARHWLAATHR